MSMSPSSQRPGITNEELKAFTGAMRKRYDLDFTQYEPKSLARGIGRLLTKYKMNGLTDLWSRILRDDDFFISHIDDLLVNLTELFRNPDAWTKIREDVLPNYINADQIDIWHAGCSTGEEIFTMAMILEDLQLLQNSRTLATDLSKRALEKAKKGTYPLKTMQNYSKSFHSLFPDREMNEFFDFDEFSATIKSHYTRNTRFEKNNLVEMKMSKKFDLILCRNVLIYFDSKLKARTLEFLTSCLKDDGFLILGYYDTMPNESIDIFKIYDNTTRIYKKKITQMIET